MVEPHESTLDARMLFAGTITQIIYFTLFYFISL